MLKISQVHPSDAQAVLDFELENRHHFEVWIASRGDGFYHIEAG